MRQSVKHVDKYLQQALHTGANNYLFRCTDNAARFVAVTRKRAAQVGLALRVAVTGEQRRILQGMAKAALPKRGGKKAAVDIIIAEVVPYGCGRRLLRRQNFLRLAGNYAARKVTAFGAGNKVAFGNKLAVCRFCRGAAHIQIVCQFTQRRHFFSGCNFTAVYFAFYFIYQEQIKRKIFFICLRQGYKHKLSPLKLEILDIFLITVLVYHNICVKNINFLYYRGLLNGIT